MLMSSYRLFWQWDGPVDYYLRILQLLEFNNYQQLALEEASDIRPTTGSDNHSQQSQQLNQSDSPILYGSEYLVEECQQIEIPENPMDKEQGVLDYIDYLLRPDHLSSNPGGGAGNDLRWTRSMHLILVERLIDCGYRQLALSMLRRQLGNQTGSVLALYRLRIASLLLDLDDAPYAAIQIAHASKVLNKFPELKEEFEIQSARLEFHHSKFDASYNSFRRISIDSDLSFPIQLRILSALLSSTLHKEERLRDVYSSCPLEQIPSIQELISSMLTRERMVPWQMIEEISRLCPQRFYSNGSITQRTKEYFILQCPAWYRSIPLTDLSSLLGAGPGTATDEDSIEFFKETAARYKISARFCISGTDNSSSIILFQAPSQDSSDQLLSLSPTPLLKEPLINESSDGTNQTSVPPQSHLEKGYSTHDSLPHRSEHCIQSLSKNTLVTEVSDSAPTPAQTVRSGIDPEPTSSTRGRRRSNGPTASPSRQRRGPGRPPGRRNNPRRKSCRPRSTASISKRHSAITQRQRQKTLNRKISSKTDSSPPMFIPRETGSNSDVEVMALDREVGAPSRHVSNLLEAHLSDVRGKARYVSTNVRDDSTLNLSTDLLNSLMKNSIKTSGIAEEAYADFVRARAAQNKNSQDYDPRLDRFVTRTRRYLKFFDSIKGLSGWPVTPEKFTIWAKNDPPSREALKNYLSSLELARWSTYKLFKEDFSDLKHERLQDCAIVKKYLKESCLKTREEDAAGGKSAGCSKPDAGPRARSSSRNLMRDDLQPSTTTVPIASTLTNPVVENQKGGLEDRSTEKGSDKSVVGLEYSMVQETTPGNLDGDPINVVLIDSSDDDSDLSSPLSSASIDCSQTNRNLSRERVNSDLIDLNRLPPFGEIRSDENYQRVYRALQGNQESLMDLEGCCMPFESTGDYTDVFYDYFQFWESRSVPWLPILPLKICLWLDSIEPAIGIGEVRMILRELEENLEVCCKGGSRICESETWRSFCEFRGFETDRSFWIDNDDKGVDEEEEGVKRAKGENCNGSSRDVKQCRKIFVLESSDSTTTPIGSPPAILKSTILTDLQQQGGLEANFTKDDFLSNAYHKAIPTTATSTKALSSSASPLNLKRSLKYNCAGEGDCSSDEEKRVCGVKLGILESSSSKRGGSGCVEGQLSKESDEFNEFGKKRRLEYDKNDRDNSRRDDTERAKVGSKDWGKGEVGEKDEGHDEENGEEDGKEIILVGLRGLVDSFKGLKDSLKNRQQDY